MKPLSNQMQVSAGKIALNEWMFERTEGVVQTGPFAGMVMLKDDAWGDGNLSPKLLGCYEEELHSAIEDEISRLSKMEKPVIVNVGCAEGYYAIGLARRLPKAVVWATDISDESIVIARRAAELNGIGNINFNGPLEEVFSGPDFVFMDCEGAEIIYLNKDSFPSLARAKIFVEMHISKDQPTDEIIAQRFQDTHEIYYTVEGPRNPNKFSMLRNQWSDTRWSAVSEGRPAMMGWFMMKPRGKGDEVPASPNKDV